MRIMDEIERRAGRVLAEAKAQYDASRPLSRARASGASRQATGFANGLPLHWMADWPMPFPMIVSEASGARLVDLDGNSVVDLCLGDTGAMFGHVPGPLRDVLMRQATRGFTTMLPSGEVERVGAKLVDVFGLPLWQMTATASDANRFAIRAARAATGRSRIVVFDGCYHGAVDDTLVDLVEGKTVPRASLLGQVVDTGLTTTSIPFNDLDALADVLAKGDVAVVLAEPVMTNCGMIPPIPGFWQAARDLTRKAGTLLLIDETHTISSGFGGYAQVHGLDADLKVIGKSIAGGIPAAVWGYTADVAARLAAVRNPADHGHSGIGTTLSGSALQIAALGAMLDHVMTREAHAAMDAHAARIAEGLAEAIARHDLGWSVIRVGARMEIVFADRAPRTAAEARAAGNAPIEQALHLALLNEGFLLTPFHNMVLISPALSEADGAAFVAAFAKVLAMLAE